MNESQPNPKPDHPPTHQRPLVIGICGGIASGKSVVTLQLEQLGAAVIHADQMGHQVLKDPEVIDTLVKYFGDEIRSAEEPSQLSRSAIAAKVFGTSDSAQKNRKFLEAVTHPRIRQSIHQQLQELRQLRSPPTAIVLDVPLLFESGWYTECDEVIFVQAPFTDRLKRAAMRGWTEEQFRAREAAQLSLVEKEKRSSVIFNNSGTLAEFQTQVREWFSRKLNNDSPNP